jgi:hypothetical protein
MLKETLKAKAIIILMNYHLGLEGTLEDILKTAVVFCVLIAQMRVSSPDTTASMDGLRNSR